MHSSKVTNRSPDGSSAERSTKQPTDRASIRVFGESPEDDSADPESSGAPSTSESHSVTVKLDGEAPKINRVWVTAALLVVMVLASMELTITSTAMPSIIGDLHGIEHYSLVMAVYLLTCTVSMPLYGRLADAIGRKRVLLWSIAVFCGASVLASTAQSMVQLIVFRGLQGLGAGGVMPIVLTILGDIFTLEERAKVQGWFSVVWGSAALAGPAIGAALIVALGWRSIFYVNLPFGALGFAVLVWRYHDHGKPHSTDLDLPGMVTLAISCAAIMALVDLLGFDGVSTIWMASVGTVAVLAGVLFMMIEYRAANPILPPALLTQRAIGPAILASGLMGVGFFGVDTFVPLYVQGTSDAGAKAAAGVVTPVMLAWATSGVFVAPLILRWGFRRTAVVGSLLMAIGFFGLYICTILQTSRWVIAGVLVIAGVGFGTSSMPQLLSVQHHVSWQQRGIVTSAVQYFRNMGGAIGIGLLGLLFNVLSAPQMQKLRDMNVSPGSIMDPLKHDSLPESAKSIIHDMIGQNLIWVFLGMAIIAVVQVCVSLMMAKTNDKAEPGEVHAIEALDALAG